MAITSAMVLFAVIWFLVLFVVLPLRLTTQGDAGDIVPGTHAGSPMDAQIGKRFLITTGVTVVLWAVCFAVIVSGWIGVDDFDLFTRFGGGGSPYGTDG
jgi:predicted secreted protein